MAEEERTQPENPKEPESVVSFQRNVSTIDLREVEAQPEALALIPESVALEHSVLPLILEDNTLTVVTEYPDDLQLIDTLAVLTKMKIKTVIPLRGNIRDAIKTHYSVGAEDVQTLTDIITPLEQTLKDIIAPIKQPTIDEEPADLAEAATNAPIVKAVDLIFTQAVKERASDIHIAPEENVLKVRYRIDGILHDALSLPLKVQSAMITRIKILA
ncbi:unnamed protein product, partial [marine sediment metagenome]